jgi:hypothetical protein
MRNRSFQRQKKASVTTTLAKSQEAYSLISCRRLAPIDLISRSASYFLMIRFDTGLFRWITLVNLVTISAPNSAETFAMCARAYRLLVHLPLKC